MRDYCVKQFPLEACGLFLGPINDDGTPAQKITHIFPTRNAEQSARVYTIDPADMLKASRYADDNGIDIVGVFHSHTHTQAYPSPTDMKQSIDPKWCYAIVSLEHEEVDVKYFALEKESVTELECQVG